MNNEELIDKVAHLLAEGKGELLEQAINDIENRGFQADNEDEEWEEWDDEDIEEYNKDSSHLVTEGLTIIKKMASTVKKPVILMPVPTLYGIALLADLGEYDCTLEQITDILHDFTFMPVKIEMITTKFLQKECMADAYEEKIQYGIIMPKQAVNKKYGYKIPADGAYLGMAAIASNLHDMADAVEAWMKMQDESGNQCIRLPQKGCAVVSQKGLYKESMYIEEEILYSEDIENAIAQYHNYTDADIFIIQRGIDTFKGLKYSKTKYAVILKKISEDTLKEIYY